MRKVTSHFSYLYTILQHFLKFLFSLFFEIGFQIVAQTDLELVVIFLPLSPKLWDYSNKSLYLAYFD